MFDQLPTRLPEFTEVEAGVLRDTRQEYVERPNVTAVVRGGPVDDGPNSRHREQLSEVRRRGAADEVRRLSLSSKAVKGKGNRRENKAVLRMKPNTTPAMGTYGEIYRKKKLKPMAPPAAAG